MGENTEISWADHTFNPVIGCMKVGPACDHCYAETLMDTRYGRVVWGQPGVGVGTRVRTSPSNWKQPLKWNRAAAASGAQPFVFCASLADVFDNQWEVEWHQDLFDLIRATPHLTWLLLTKRPQMIRRLYYEAIADANHSVSLLEQVGAELPRNAAIGCTVVTQEEADRDIPHLLRAKAALNPAFAFLSIEPMLGPIDLAHVHPIGWSTAGPRMNCLTGGTDYPHIRSGERIDWVICGGESGAQARPMHPDWARSLRDQCAAAGVPFHFKQHGEWLDGVRVGKNRAGREIDGVVHDARPNVVG